MKGFGWSDKPEDAKYDTVTLMQEVNKWMDVMGLKDVVFVGNSLGGAIAVLMALEHPDKTDLLVLIDSAGYPIKKPFIIRMAKMPLAGEITKLFFGRWVVKSTLKEVLFNDDMVTEEKIDAYFHRMSTENAVDAQTALARSFDFEALSSYTRRIPEIKNRTVIIWGENDEWIPLESGHNFKRDLSNSKLVILPECGHIPQEEKPEQTAQIMIDFIEKR
jgi:pimeloyl-ACP methyl ester carboxylesterase